MTLFAAHVALELFGPSRCIGRRFSIRVVRLIFCGVVLNNDRRSANWKKGLVLGDKKETRADHLQSVMSDSRFDEWTRQYDFGMPKAIRDLAYGCVMTGVPITAKPHAKPQVDFLQAILDIFRQVAPAYGATTA